MHSTSFIIIATTIGALTSGALGYGLCFLVLRHRERKDTEKVYAHMRKHIPMDNSWLTTTNISDNTSLSLARVEYICAKDERIMPVAGMGRVVWGLLDISEEYRK